MVTFFFGYRWNLITKEKMVDYCKGEERFRKKSVNDDLESFLDSIRLGKRPNGFVTTYLLPKLTREELNLVTRKDYNYLKTFKFPDPDVNKDEMEASESDSKFVFAYCWRQSSIIENP